MASMVNPEYFPVRLSEQAKDALAKAAESCPRTNGKLKFQALLEIDVSEVDRYGTAGYTIEKLSPFVRPNGTYVSLRFRNKNGKPCFAGDAPVDC